MNISDSNHKPLAKTRIIDYDIHGIVGIRLIDPGDPEAAAVVNQLGPPHPPLNREPDIIIRFKDNIPLPGLKYLGLNYAGFNDDGFYILRSSKADAKARIPFEKIGGQCEIICERGLRSVPLLIAIVNLTFLSKNYLPLHASGFVYNGVGILVAGWSKGGKTEALLSFGNHGAQYVADEWTILSEDGREMFGIAEPIRLWDWQLEFIPGIRKKMNKQKKILFKSIHFMEAFHRSFARGKIKNIFPLKALSEALPAFRRQLNIRILPQDIFENRFCESATPEKVFLIMSHSDPNIVVESCDPAEITRRMMSSNEYEQVPFFEYYRAFKYAFPDQRNEFLENINKLQHSLLNNVLEGKEAYRVLHPYPVSFEKLFKKMQPYCGEKTENVLKD
jgi:hypothetical protein